MSVMAEIELFWKKNVNRSILTAGKGSGGDLTQGVFPWQEIIDPI